MNIKGGIAMTHDIAREVEKLADDLGFDRKRSIGDVAKELGIETHIIRFWEEKFPQIRPEIGAGKRRYYYNKQLKVLKRVKKFLYEDGYTIYGLQKMLKKRKKDDCQQEDLDLILQGNVQTTGVKEYVNQDVKVTYGFNDDEKGELEFLLSSAKNSLERLKRVAQECSHI